MALAVTWVKPLDGDQIPGELANVFESYVAFNGPPTGSAYRYRVYGSGGAWTLISGFNGQTTIPANTFTNGQQYEVERNGATASDSGSSVIIIDVAVSSATPTVSAPTSPINAPTATVTWATAPTTQQYAQVQVLDTSGNVVWDSGVLAQTAQTLAGVPFPDTGVTRTVRVRIKRAKAYSWSQWGTTGNLTVTHTPPPQPTVVDFNPIDPTGTVGYPHTLLAQVAQPAPGAAPAVVRTEFYVRVSGSAGPGILVGSSDEAGGASWFYFTGPRHGVLYEIQARNVAADGRSNTSAWKQANGSITVKGVLLSTAEPTMPVKLNKVVNPSFEVDVSGWSVNNGTIARVADAGGAAGDFSAGWTATATGTQWAYTSALIPMRLGRAFAAAAMLRMITTAADHALQLLWYVDGINVASTLVSVPLGQLSGTTFTRMLAAAEPPRTDINGMRLAVRNVPGTVPNGSGFRFDAASLVELPLVRNFRLNGEEAEDDYQPEAALIQYDGREFPVAEFGTSSSRDLTVELSMRLDADRDGLRALQLARTPVLYRDRRGRKVYGLLTVEPIMDTFYGYSTRIKITALDYPLDRAN